MHLRVALRNKLIPAAFSLGFLGCLAANQSIHAQSATSERLVVTGEEVPSAYGATPDFSRSRFSNLVNAYVLPPGAVYFGLIYQGDALRFNRPDNLFTQEVEIGLPHRFGIAFENSTEFYRSTPRIEPSALKAATPSPIGTRFLSIPRSSLSTNRASALFSTMKARRRLWKKVKPRSFWRSTNLLPDAVEVRLLLAQNFGKV